MDYGITICVPVPFAEAVARAWLAACMQDDWHGDHGTNDSRRAIPPWVFLGVLGNSARLT